MLYVLSFIVQFSIGGFTGLMLGALAVNIHVQDTYFVVGHFHYVMFGGTGFGLFAAMHYWFPKMFGRMYAKKPAVVAWALATDRVQHCSISPFFFLGYLGMPRRYYDYLPEYQVYHVIATVGSWILVTGIDDHGRQPARRPAARAAGRLPTRGEGGTLEWTVPSPPPAREFSRDPDGDDGTLRLFAIRKTRQRRPREHTRPSTEGGHVHRDDVGSRMGMWLFLFTELILFGGIVHRLRRLPVPPSRRSSISRPWSWTRSSAP